jgi:putative ABC transport system substrate-binding protein
VVGAPVLAACAERISTARRPARIGVFGFLGSQATVPTVFLDGLRERGYVEGRDVTFEYHWADLVQAYRSPGGIDRVAAELVASGVDLILCPYDYAARAARDATSDVPIVVVLAFDAADPVIEGTGVAASPLVQSLARPGANVTGTTMTTRTVMGKRLELLAEILPRAAFVGALASDAPGKAAIEQAVRAGGLRIQIVNVRRAADLDFAFGTLVSTGVEAVIVFEDPLLAAERARIGALGIEHRLPTITGDRIFAEAGALLSYGASFDEAWRRTATYVDKILKGAKPADLPVEAASKFELVVNRRTATRLGVTFPPTLLARANEVID